MFVMRWLLVYRVKALAAAEVAVAPYIFKPPWIQNSERNEMDLMPKWMLLMKKSVFIPFDLYLIRSKIFYTQKSYCQLTSTVVLVQSFRWFFFVSFQRLYFFAWISKVEVHTVVSNLNTDWIIKPSQYLPLSLWILKIANVARWIGR